MFKEPSRCWVLPFGKPLWAKEQGCGAGLSPLVLEEGLALLIGVLLPPLPAPSHAALCLSLHPISPTFLIPVLSPSVLPQQLLPCLIHPGLHIALEPHSHPHLALRPVPSPSCP